MPTVVEEGRGAAQHGEQERERQPGGGEAERVRGGLADQSLLLGLVDGSLEPVAEGVLELVAGAALLLGELVELVDAAQREHEVLA